jgi:proteasome lid subunit RPN8/RPN11
MFFPNINKRIDKIKSSYSKNCISLLKLKELSSYIKKYELGGEYIPGCGFLIHPETTHYDKKQDRPYTILKSKTGIVFHTHPFIEKEKNTFPSIEDLNMLCHNPKMIGIIICLKGVFIIKSRKRIHKMKSLDILDDIYQSLSLSNIEQIYINKIIDLKEYGFEYKFYNWKEALIAFK